MIPSKIELREACNLAGIYKWHLRKARGIIISPTNNISPHAATPPFDTDLPDCADCGEKLCLREKTINLAVGNTDIMYCLDCLSKKETKPAPDILAKIKKYVLARECFRKEWIKYKDLSCCPKPDTCFPDTCFRK